MALCNCLQGDFWTGGDQLCVQVALVWLQPSAASALQGRAGLVLAAGEGRWLLPAPLCRRRLLSHSCSACSSLNLQAFLGTRSETDGDNAASLSPALSLSVAFFFPPSGSQPKADTAL